MFITRPRIFNKIIAIAVIGAVLYWFAESVMEYFLFKDGSLISYIFPSLPHEIFMRSAVVVVIIILGVVIQKSVNKVLGYTRKIDHLNRVLGAIRDVNQLITREQDVHKLLSEICNIMIRDRGYYNCWIAVSGKGKVSDVYHAGFEGEGERLSGYLKRGGRFQCMDKVSDKGFTVIENPKNLCAECFLKAGYEGRGAFCAELKRKKVYGHMVLSVPGEYTKDKEEIDLFLEVAGDIAFALEKIELEESKQESEKLIAQTAQKFLELFNSVTDAVFIHDFEGNFLEVNDEACRRLGYSREEFLKMTPVDIDSPKYASRVKEKIEQLKNEGHLFAESAHITRGGAEIPVELNSKIINYEGRKAILTVARDITERKKAQEKINRLIYYDSLTGLPNRRLFDDRINMAIADAQRNKKRLAVYMLDVDDFKDINDNMGHAVGDMLLKWVGQRIKRIIRKTDTLARLGGDEFIMLVTGVGDNGSVERVARKVIDVFAGPIDLDGRKVSSTVSIGIALYPGDGNTSEKLIRNADKALYKVKGRGKNDFAFCSSEPM
ncbi:MAG: diguanylate cyclase domain-containing protein [Actinomycetota bacterium]